MAIVQGILSFLLMGHSVNSVIHQKQTVSQRTSLQWLFSGASFHFYSWGIVLTVSYTKNRQCHCEPLCIPIPKIPKSQICPIALLQKHFRNFKFSKNSPAFLVHDHSVTHSLNTPELRWTIISLTSMIHLYPAYYSAHSLRCSSASFAFASVHPSELINPLDTKSFGTHIGYQGAPGI